MSTTLVTTVQVILELVFGFGEDRLSPELVDHYTRTFIVLVEHLFSYPINLPGFGEVLSAILRREAQACHVVNLVMCMRTVSLEGDWLTTWYFSIAVSFRASQAFGRA